MASIIMHIAVGKQLYNKIKDKIDINYQDFILGSIAPDMSKLLAQSKEKSHFFNNNKDIPDLEMFLNKYQSTLNNSFNLGYYVHLHTDKIFYQDFLPLFIKDDILESNVKLLNGDILKLSLEDRKNLLYNDYTNLNIQVIDEYNLDLKMFYNDIEIPITNIDEIDINKINILLDNTGIIIENSTNNKDYIIDISSIKAFIDDSVEEIYKELLLKNII